jgi:DNA-directed RNA polymerase subunit beta'
MLSAQAITEPLTQLSLNAKHATRTASSEKAVLSGLEGLKQLTEIPQNFFNAAVLAPTGGTITTVKKAPQGGHYVYINDVEHYLHPALDPQVKAGAVVQAGDVLSSGIPRPDEVLKHKGLEAGRDYMVQQLQGIYKGQGMDVDRRHLELVAKTDMNYVRLTDPDSHRWGFIRGEVIDVNALRNAIAEHPELKQEPAYEPVMKPLSRTPLMHPDWMARLAHRNLKNVILDAAAFGESSPIHGTHPVLPFAWGAEFGRGPKGQY